MSPALRAAIYCRISLARDESTAGVDRQEKDCRALAKRRGWTVADVHVDNSVSAWQRNRKRPGWDALLAGIKADAYDAVVVYHGDRLIRQSMDLEVLLQLATDKGIRLASILGDRDLDNMDDRYILRIEAASATRESDNTSRRVTRANLDKVAQGLPHATGRRPFGYERDGITIRQDEADVVAEVASRLLAGETVGALVRDLNRRGITSSAGNPWTHGALKKMLTRPRLAGLRQHHKAAPVPAVWPALLDRTVWEAVVARLDGTAHGFTYATNARRYLLSGIALCGTCGQPLAIRHNTRAESLRGYGCIQPGCRRKVHRSVKHLDEFVVAHVLARLADPRVARGLREPARGKSASVGGQITALEQRRRTVVKDFTRSAVLTTADLESAVSEIDQRLAELRSRLGGQSRRRVLDGMAGLDRAAWEALPLDRQRALVSALLRVTVLPSTRRGPGFDPAAVKVEPV